MHRTLVICKPDAVERRLVGEIIRRIEEKGLRILAAELRQLDADLAKRHYDEHRQRPFFDDLVGFLTSGPALIMVVGGSEDAWLVVRNLIGATNPLEALPGTIRGDLALNTRENLVHGSDSPHSAEREIALFFPDL